MGPLAGLRIVVTRPRDQAATLAGKIVAAGGEAILFPLLEIAPIADPGALDALVARLPEFDLAIFISPNAVRYGLRAIRATRDLPPSLKIAAVGQGSAATLRDEGVLKVIAPQERSDSEALLALPELQNLQGWRVAIFRGEDGRELLGEILKARGARVEYAACYRRSKPRRNMADLLDTQPDALTVTSSEALQFLWEGLDETARKQVAAVPLFVQHERIAAAARNLGWREVNVTGSGDDGLFAGLVEWAARRRG